MQSYYTAIDDIVKGAKSFLKVCSGQEGATYQEPDETFSKVTNEAFCLNLAYKVWHDIIDRMCFPIPSQTGLLGAGVGMTDPPTKKKQAISQKDTFLKLLREQFSESEIKDLSKDLLVEMVQQGHEAEVKDFIKDLLAEMKS